jgi:hypothetical protein
LDTAEQIGLDTAEQIGLDTAEQLGLDTAEQIDAAWQAVYCRHPSTREREASLQFLVEQRSVFEQQADYKASDGKPPAKSAELEALAVMCQMLMGSNEFLYVD